MNYPVERIQTLLKQNKISVNKISKEIGLNSTFFSAWKAGRAKPSTEALMKIANYFNVSVDYLLGRTDDPTPGNADKFPAEDMLELPVYATVAAGFDRPISSDNEDEGDTQHVPRSIVHGYDKEDLFVFLVSGDSMSPKFMPGDRVLVVKQDSVDSGDIAIVCYKDYEDGTIKKVMYEPGCDYVDLVPANPAYAPIRLQGDELATCRVVGKVIYLFRKI